MNTFKGLDLVNGVPEELWTEVRNIVQEAANKTIPKKKKSRKAKWLSEEASQMAKGRREVKSKGERQACIQLKADFQRAAQRDGRAFSNDPCIKLEENSSLQENRRYQGIILSKDMHNKGHKEERPSRR